jgi:hypothetical protein
MMMIARAPEKLVRHEARGAAARNQGRAHAFGGIIPTHASVMRGVCGRVYFLDTFSRVGASDGGDGGSLGRARLDWNGWIGTSLLMLVYYDYRYWYKNCGVDVG